MNRSKIAPTLFILLGWLFLITISIPIYFSIKNAYGDLLFAEDLFVDIIRKGGSWFDWSFTPSPSFFPDLTLYYLSFLTLENVMDRIFAVSMMQIILIALTIQIYIRQLIDRKFYNTSFITLILVSAISYLSYTTDIWMYFNANNNHIGSLILSLISLIFLLRTFKYSRKSDFILLFVFSTVAIVSGQVYLVSFYATALSTLSLFLVINIIARGSSVIRKTIILNILLLLLSFLLAKIISSIVNPYPQFWYNTHLDAAAITYSLRMFVLSIESISNSKNILLYFLSLIWVIGLAATLITLLKSVIVYKNNDYNNLKFIIIFSLSFTLILIPVNFLGAVLSGGIRMHGGLRYFMLPITMPILQLLIILLLFNYKIIENRHLSKTLAAISLIVLTLFIFNFSNYMERRREAYITSSASYWYDQAFRVRKVTIEDVKNHNYTHDKIIADCLDNNYTKYNLKYGVGFFWDTVGPSLLSKNIKGIYQINPDFFPRTVMNSVQRFLGNNGAFHPIYNFIVTGPELTVEIARNTLGLEDAFFVCPTTRNNIVLVYNDDGLDKLIKSKAKIILKK